MISIGGHPQPHSVLGPHPAASGTGSRRTEIRVLRPHADAVSLVFSDGTTLPLSPAEDGLWIGQHDGDPSFYRVRTLRDGRASTIGDPYRHAPTLSEEDRRRIRNGDRDRLWEALGANARPIGTEIGVAFAIWAPRAEAVRIVGPLAETAGAPLGMRRLDPQGIWELFVPDASPGTAYAYEILTDAGTWVRASDPFGRRADAAALTGSVVDFSTHIWRDGAWMTRRAATRAVAQPMSVYQLHLGSWRDGLGYATIAEPLIEHVLGSGFTHVEFLPFTVPAAAGRIRATSAYAPDPRYGTSDELRSLIDRLHRAGIGVLLEWEPTGIHPLSYETAIDFDDAAVRAAVTANALYWFDSFHIDGLRLRSITGLLYLDHARGPGEWTPNIHGGRENLAGIRFLQDLNRAVHRSHPGAVTIAVESGRFPGVTAAPEHAGLGFTLKWNDGWAEESLRYMRRTPVERAHHEGEMTFSFVYAFGENYLLPLGHDETSHRTANLLTGLSGPDAARFADLRAFLGHMWGHPGKKLLFMGQEFGQLAEWTTGTGLEWDLLEQPPHAALLRLIGRMNETYRSTAPLWEYDRDRARFDRRGAPTWDPDVIAFERRDAHGGRVLVISNFDETEKSRLALDLPVEGIWDEILNTDDVEYGGTGSGNDGWIVSRRSAPGDAPQARITLPARSTLWLRYRK